MTPRARAGAALAAWVAFLVAVVVVLHAVGGSLAPPPLDDLDGARAWMDQRQPVEVVFAVLRLVALALGWYLLAATVMAAVARLLRLAAVVTVVDVVTLPAVRRLVNSALGLSLMATTYPGLAAAGTAEPPPVETMRRLPDASTPAPQGPTVTMHRLPDGPAASPSPPPQAAAARAPAAPPTSWPVRPGDHFWAVAERVLNDTWGRAPSDAEIVPYWRALIEANRSRLHDPDNPDLLYPGQTLTVPPPPPRPG